LDGDKPDFADVAGLEAVGRGCAAERWPNSQTAALNGLSTIRITTAANRQMSPSGKTYQKLKTERPDRPTKPTEQIGPAHERGAQNALINRKVSEFLRG
jgi:hypothetical protein